MKNYEWKSSLSEHIRKYIAFKRAAGLKFARQETLLQLFDRFHFYNGYQGTEITMEMAREFIYVTGESPSSRRDKEVLLRDFGTYMQNLGFRTYIPEVTTPLHRSRYIPHIYTKSELRRFFNAIEEYPVGENSSRKTVDAILFRFLYGTGVRISEALNLKVSDYDPEAGAALIRQGKNNRDRIVALHPSLMKRVNAFLEDFHKESQPDTPLFPNSRMQRIRHNAIYDRFRDYLLMADIPHTGNGPRIHDFRHGFAVENLRRWSAEGGDLMNLMPYLAAYMGHSDYKATQYYLRLTAEIYPEMMEQLESECMDIIPGGDCHEET